jgi:hypothetical protein
MHGQYNVTFPSILYNWTSGSNNIKIYWELRFILFYSYVDVQDVFKIEVTDVKFM